MHLVQEIGSYAGFAAVVGLAILSALYFSQARDVKRLREWAGRAPERAVEQEARVTAQAQQRAAASGGGPAVAPSPVRPQPAPAPPTTVSPGAQPPPTTIPGTRPTPAPTTPILGSMNEPDPWYRRIHWPAPRYIALIVVGILVLGAGAAYGVSQLGNNNSSTTGTPAAVSGGGGSSTSHTKHTSKKTAPAINPKSITVAVLNGTTVTGLAATMADKVEQAGFTRGNTTNALTQGQQAESVVEYSKGNNASAQLVARKLGIGQIQQIDPQTQTVAGDATVTVIVGADKANGSG